MLRLAGAFLVFGLGSEVFSLASADGSPIAQVLGFTTLTLAMILLMLGSRTIRNLVS
jgi:hypothetical protein